MTLDYGNYGISPYYGNYGIFLIMGIMVYSLLWELRYVPYYGCLDDPNYGNYGMFLIWVMQDVCHQQNHLLPW